MFNGKKVIGLIPARGGSKRLPRKNILPLCDKPMIAWTIEAALKSKYIDDTIVSTDDPAIDLVSYEHNADRVISRPPKFASDTATSRDVLLHALNYLHSDGLDYGYVALLQPTSPLRQASHIDEGFELMLAKKARAVIGVCLTEHPSEWMGKLPSSWSMNRFLKSVNHSLSKDNLEETYLINGALYLLKIPNVFSNLKILPESRVYAYVMDRDRSVDVDSRIDLIVAATLMKEYLRNHGG